MRRSDGPWLFSVSRSRSNTTDDLARYSKKVYAPHDPLVKVLVILVAVTGMRISEALALTWDAIDWVKGKIRIRRKWNGKGYGPPKSLMSRSPLK